MLEASRNAPFTRLVCYFKSNATITAKLNEQCDKDPRKCQCSGYESTKRMRSYSQRIPKSPRRQSTERFESQIILTLGQDLSDSTPNAPKRFGSHSWLSMQHTNQPRSVLTRCLFVSRRQATTLTVKMSMILSKL